MSKYLETLDQAGPSPSSRMRYRDQERHKTACGGFMFAIFFLVMSITSAALLWQFLSSPNYTQNIKDSPPQNTNSGSSMTIPTKSSQIAGRITASTVSSFNISMYVTPIFFS